MITGKTSTGFKYTVDEKKAKDWELIEIVAKMQKADSDMQVFVAVMDVIDFLIGDDQKERLKAHCRQLYGYVDADKFTTEIFEIIGSARNAPETKNSSSSPVVSQPTRKPSSVISQNTTEFTTIDPSRQTMPQHYAQDSGMEAGFTSPLLERNPLIP